MSLDMDFRFHAPGLHAMPMVMAPPTAATTSRKNKSQRCSICGGLGRAPPGITDPARERNILRRWVLEGQAAARGISVGYVLVSIGAKGGRSWTLPRGVSLELLLKRLKGQIASCRQADLQLELTFRRGAVAAQGAKLE